MNDIRWVDGRCYEIKGNYAYLIASSLPKDTGIMRLSDDSYIKLGDDSFSIFDGCESVKFDITQLDNLIEALLKVKNYEQT